MLGFAGKWDDAGYAALFMATYGVAGTGIFTLCRQRHQSDRNGCRFPPPTIQLHLTPQGYSARRGFGPPHPLLHWNCDLEMDLTYTSPIARLRIARLSPVGTVDWSSIVDLAFPATAQQVDGLRAAIELLRSRQGAE